MHKVLMWLTQFLPMKAIGDCYLERYHVIKLGKFEVRLHRFVNGDPEEHFHDHPFHALCFILTEGYVEQRRDSCGRLNWSKPRVNLILAHRTIHRIYHCTPNTWSLNLVWRTGGGWGFYNNNRYVLATPSDEFWYKTATKRNG